jgi:glycosidase
MNSHDTDRLASMARNPDRAYDHGNRIQDNGPNYDNGKPTAAEYRRARLAALIQMTYVGAPMVYYGDEVGMWGADDPTCRKPMLWTDLEPYEQPKENTVERDHLAYYRRIIALRNAHPALRTGTIQTVLADDQADVWAIIRRNHNEQVLVVLNAAEVPRTVTVPLPPSAANSWTGVYNAEGVFQPDDTRDARGRKLLLTVPAVGGIVLHAPTPK